MSLDGARSKPAAPGETTKEHRGPVEDRAGASHGAARDVTSADVLPDPTVEELASISTSSDMTDDVGPADPTPSDGREPAPVLDEAGRTWSGSMAKLVRDLEFSRGLPEPLQQNVVPAPAPWTPPAEASVNPAPTIDAVVPRAGRSSGGEPVTIRGHNLDPMLVMFGLIPATIVQKAQDLVVVAAPPGGPGEAPIVVTNRDGNYAISTVAYRYER